MGCGCRKAATTQAPKKFDIRHAVRDAAVEKANVARKAVTGKEYKTKFVDDDVKLLRRLTCGDPDPNILEGDPRRNCPTHDRIESLDICGVCKCFINQKIKFKDSFCPRGHWGPVGEDGKEEVTEAAIPAGVALPGEEIDDRELTD